PQYTPATAPIQAAITADRPKSLWPTTESNACASYRRTSPTLPYTRSAERTWPASAAEATTRPGSTQSATASAMAKPASDGSQGLSASTPLVTKSHTRPSPTSRGLEANDDSGTPKRRFAAVPAPTTAVAAATPTVRRVPTPEY